MTPAAAKPDTLASALAQLQTALPEVAKGQTADAGTYSYSYADLAACSVAIMPKLGEVGLSFSSKPMLTEDGRFVLRYVLRHTSNEDDGGDYPLPDPTRSSAQQVGSAISYARRYTLCAVTGLTPRGDDDDGKAASQVPHYETGDSLPDPRLPLFSAIKTAARARKLTDDETAADFAVWSEGTAIRSATAEQLTAYAKYLRDQEVPADA